MMRNLLTFMSIAVLGFMPAQAFAQFSTDSTADTILYADDTVSANGVITLTGQADIRQGNVRLLADQVKIFTQSGEGGSLVSTDGIERIVAAGNFYYITPEQEVRGDKAVYTRATDSFIVTGDVVLLQDDSVVRGSELDYNLTTRAAKVVGNCKGRKCGTNRRVAILIRSTNSQQRMN